MKCPKCKHIAFDYLATCPRCGKDMSEEQTKLNIASFKPNPPFLLGSLTGNLDDSGTDINVSESTQEGVDGIELKDAEVYDDGSELEIDLEKEDISESSEDADLGDLGLPDVDKELGMDFNISPEAAEEDVKGEEVREEGSGGEEGAQKEETGEDSEAIDLDLDDLDLELEGDEDSKG
ncbi:MAG: hypothetical protein V3R28_01350 [Desulfatiglandales bacterium]